MTLEEARFLILKLIGQKRPKYDDVMHAYMDAVKLKHDIARTAFDNNLLELIRMGFVDSSGDHVKGLDEIEEIWLTEDGRAALAATLDD